MQSNKLPQNPLQAIIENLGMIFASDCRWNDFLDKNGIVKDRHIQITTEGALIGSIIEHGISKHLVIVSDDLFDKIFTQTTSSAALNLALKRINNNKSELLLVLERPDIPLHNNGAESAIREYVKKRKISGSTRSDLGRKCRDTFISLKKTCRKLEVSFWQYLKDRIEKICRTPDLSDLVRQRALKPG